MNIWINIGIYQAIWFLCVFLENVGALLSLPLILLHLYLSPYKLQDAKLDGDISAGWRYNRWDTACPWLHYV